MEKKPLQNGFFALFFLTNGLKQTIKFML